jgi:hypothetical protein
MILFYKEFFMFSFLQKKFSGTGRAALAALVLLAVLLFASCPQPSDSGTPPPTGPGPGSPPGTGPGTDAPPAVTAPSGLQGMWINQKNGDVSYTIKGAVFSYKDFAGYGGTIVNVRSGDGEGYITINYTYNDYMPSVAGKFYVIHYKNLTASTVSFSGSVAVDGKSTQKEAEDEYAADKYYFGFYTDVANLGGDTFSNKMEGRWKSAELVLAALRNTVTLDITDKVIRYQATAGPVLVGKIVKVVNEDTQKGYLVFKVVAGFSASGVDAYNTAGGYSVLRWTNYSLPTVTLGMGGLSNNIWTTLTATQTKTSIKDAEEAFVDTLGGTIAAARNVTFTKQ